MTAFRTIFPHLLRDADVLGAGPSPWVTCSRPSCRLVYRSLAFIRVVPPPCPMCGQPVIPAKRGHQMTAAQRQAVRR